MATYEELNQEAAWRAEITSPALDWLADQLCAYYGRPRTAAGTKGDNNHLRGAHRSRRWILTSKYCTNRTYTVSHAADKMGDEDWIAGLDFSPGSEKLMMEICSRLDSAVREGTIEEISEWYGNIDGDEKVDGYNNIVNRIASSDSSHLWHLHITFLRRYAGDVDVMTRTFSILTGETMTAAEFLKILQDPDVARLMRAFAWQYVGGGIPPGYSTLRVLNEMHSKVTSATVIPSDIVARLDAILAAAQDDGNTTVVLGPEALSEFQAVRADIAAIPNAVLAETVERLGE